MPGWGGHGPRRSAVGVAVGAFLLAVACGSARAAELEFQDEFDGPVLEAGWSFVREKPANHSLSDRPGFFRVNTQPGTFGVDSTIENLLLRDFSGDFILEARVEFDPQTPQQFAGVVAYLDDTHAVALGLVFVQGMRGTFRGVVMTSDGEGTDPDAPRPASRYDESNADEPDVVFLRLLRLGDQFVGAFSADGDLYRDIGTVTNVMPAGVRVGVGAANAEDESCGAACDISITADFDWFKVFRLGDGPPDPNVDVVLETVILDGPEEVRAGGNAQFTASAVFSDDTESDVSDEAEWLISPASLGTIDAGVLDADAVTETRQATVVASFTQLTSGGAVTKTASRTVRITRSGGGGGGGGVGCGAGVALTPILVTLRLVRSRRTPRRY